MVRLISVLSASAIILSATVAHARSTVVSHAVDVASVKVCSTIAAKQKWILTDAIKTKSGYRCLYVEIVDARSQHNFPTPQPNGSVPLAVGSGSR